MKTLWEEFAEDNLDKTPSRKLYRMLETLYSQPHRFYHNLGHVKFLLGLFEEFADSIKDRPAVFFAVWFHDAIYDARQSDNERQSAAFAAEWLPRISVPAGTISKVEKMILATEKHSPDGLDADGRLFLDFDLAILGANAETYADYAEAIRREYDFVSEAEYRAGRARVLRNFLRREFIYFTEPMRERFETRARRNIEQEIEKL